MICSPIMIAFNFELCSEVQHAAGVAALAEWALPPDDEPEYRNLIANHRSLSPDEFERIGNWKDDVGKSVGRWSPNVASVAYLIWMQAVQEPPRCPAESEVEAFLDGWSDRRTRMYFQTKQWRNTLGCPERQRYSISSAEGVTRPSTRALSQRAAFGTFDTDPPEDHEICRMHNVLGLPFLAFYWNGAFIYKTTGLLSVVSTGQHWLVVSSSCRAPHAHAWRLGTEPRRLRSGT